MGKTLIVKQLLFFEKGIEESDDATTIISNPCWRDEIRREMIDAIQVLAVETEKKNLSIEEPYTLLGKDHNIRTLRTDILDSTVNPNIFFVCIAIICFNSVFIFKYNIGNVLLFVE